RRQAEEWIREGKVRVNGKVVTELGTKVDPETDRIAVSGKPIPPERSPVVVLLNKPAGYVTTVRDPHAERTVMDLLKGLDRRVYPVGRLDKDSRGVLLLTDDGELANRLLHPSGTIEKVYRVTATGPLTEESLARLAAGVELEDGLTAPARVWDAERTAGGLRFQIALSEGRKRQVRLMVRAVGGRVNDLLRVSFAGLTAGGLPEGGWRILGSKEVERLKRALKSGGRKAKAPREALSAPAGDAGPRIAASRARRSSPSDRRPSGPPSGRRVERPLGRRRAAEVLRGGEAEPGHPRPRRSRGRKA
ncbi:MAG: rRNA pseudouridine synthase, partial [Deltaproteobacteria bacterium]|nr:rRNA pseudouridine synthase [Deltaproteobacteria bacterium]